MKLRFCPLLALTLLAGCVLTDESNQTGGDFLASHGTSVLPSEARTIGVSALKVEAIPMEGVPGSHGTEDVVLGALGEDSIRLILGFNLQDTALRTGSIKTGALTRLRLVSLDLQPEMKVRARFLFINDTNELPGLLAGLDSAAFQNDDHPLPATVADIEVTLAKRDVNDSAVLIELPAAVAASLQAKMTGDPTKPAWLVVLLDSRTGGANTKVRYNTNVSLVGPDTSLTHTPDASGSLALGTYENHKTWRSVGMRRPGAPVCVGWWPSGGSRLRVRLDAAKLRSDLSAAYGIAPDVEGGFDHTFNVLQARLNTPIKSVLTDGTGPFPMSISSTVIMRDAVTKELVKLGHFFNSTSKEAEITLDPDEQRACGWTVNPMLTFRWKPGVYQMTVTAGGEAYPMSTRQSLARGSNSDFTQTKVTIPFGEVVEFRINTLIRVRVTTTTSSVLVTYQVLEQNPAADNQRSTSDSLRHEAMMWPATSLLTQEVRTPLTQVLNRWRAVDLDLTPYALEDVSSRLVAVPADPANLFSNLQVVVRPLIGRNN